MLYLPGLGREPGIGKALGTVCKLTAHQEQIKRTSTKETLKVLRGHRKKCIRGRRLIQEAFL